MNEEASSRKPSGQRSWLERLSQLLLREPQDRHQLIELLRDAGSRQLLDASALRMIEGVMQISTMTVEDIMIPRSQMIVVAEDASPEAFLPELIESAHSRFPVIGNNRDEVIGILLAKELLPYCSLQSAQPQEFRLKDLLRPATFVPESKRLNLLLNDFRETHNHMAIVVNEYGGVAGLVTIEDILEQIVGDIEDEYDIDEDHPEIREVAPNQYHVEALLPIEEFNEYFEVQLSDEEFDTIGGLVINGFGHVPRNGDVIELEQFAFQVLEADDRRLIRLNVQRRPQAGHSVMSESST